MVVDHAVFSEYGVGDIIGYCRFHLDGHIVARIQIPYWKEVKELCRNAARHNTSNRSIGWDVAITENGPSFVEGNHNWCKLLWQLPAGEGLKSVLDHYLKDILVKKGIR